MGRGPAVNPWIIALTVTLATFMEVLDTSVANVALPHIAGSLSAGQDESTWVLTSYLVSNAIVLPMSGWFSQLIGRKRFYMTCVAVFTISSFLCGLAPSLGMLIFFRVLQGAGGGGLQPSEQAILADTFPPRSAAWLSPSMAWPSCCARDRPDARRMDHGQLQLALDFLHQHSRRNHFADPHQPADLRSAVHGGAAQAAKTSASTTSASACWRSASAHCRSCSIRASGTTGSARTSSSS